MFVCTRYVSSVLSDWLNELVVIAEVVPLVAAVVRIVAVVVVDE